MAATVILPLAGRPIARRPAGERWQAFRRLTGQPGKF